jgi:hypothetical protein
MILYMMQFFQIVLFVPVSLYEFFNKDTHPSQKIKIYLIFDLVDHNIMILLPINLNQMLSIHDLLHFFHYSSFYSFLIFDYVMNILNYFGFLLIIFYESIEIYDYSRYLVAQQVLQT